ncbi:MAG: hypothetical protein ACM3ST_13450 [Bdellovibrio bacteriovorus]
MGQRPGADGTLILIPSPVVIPAGSAHARFQGGRQVAGTGRLDPYCELEIRTVSEAPQEALPGRYRVSVSRYTLLLDPTTRLPALLTGFNCSDPLFQESFWRLSSEAGGNLHSLRCIRPIYHCALVPPLTLDEVGAITGPAIQVQRPDG